MFLIFLKTLLYEVDIFKVPFVLLFKNRKKSSTLLGSLFSIGIFTLLIYLLAESNMILKINPLVIDQTTTNDHTPLIELTPQNFNVAAGVADSLGHGYLDPTIFKIKFVQIEIDDHENKSTKQILAKEKIDSIPCTNNSFSDPDLYTNMNLKNFQCLVNGNFRLEGGFDEKAVNGVVILISYCDNKTDGIVCKPKTYIDNFFLDKGLWLYYQDDIYDVQNYKNPIKKNWRLQAIQCGNSARIVDLYLKKLYFINDDGFLFHNEKTTIGFMKERIEELSHYVMIESPLVSINIFSSKNTQITMRRYQKLGELLATIGGIIHALMILGNFITNLINQLQMQNHIMNSLYDYSFDKNLKIPLRKKIKKKSKTKPDFDPDPDIKLYNWNNFYEENVQFDKEIVLDLENIKKPHIIKNDELSDVNIKDTSRNLEIFPSSHRNKIDSVQDSFETSRKLQAQNKTKLIKMESHEKIHFDSPIGSPPKDRKLTKEVQQKILFPLNSIKKIEVMQNLDENKPISFRIFEYLKMKCKILFRNKMNPKENLYLLSEKRFNYETDIVYILEKIQQFEKFKMIILNEKQQGFFNLLAKPLIHLQSQKDQYKQKTRNMISRSMSLKLQKYKNPVKKRIEELEVCYDQLSQQQHLSDIDKNLLQIIEKDIFM